jgi:hypothetical protein
MNTARSIKWKYRSKETHQTLQLLPSATQDGLVKRLTTRLLMRTKTPPISTARVPCRVCRRWVQTWGTERDEIDGAQVDCIQFLCIIQTVSPVTHEGSGRVLLDPNGSAMPYIIPVPTNVLLISRDEGALKRQLQEAEPLHSRCILPILSHGRGHTNSLSNPPPLP